MKKLLNFIFAFEIGAMIFALVIFQVIPSKMIAGLVAGAVFVALGVTIGALGGRSEFRKTATFPLGLIYLFVAALPMIAVRLIHYGVPFESLRIFGLSGPNFHHVSEALYLLLLLGTAFDRLRVRAKALSEANLQEQKK